MDNALTQANWEDSDIQARIDEGGAYIDGKILMLGYSQSQLSSAPLIKNINVLYARFAILRDIFARISPSKTDEAGFVKWKEQVDEILNDIIEGKTKLVDNSGEVIVPEKRDKRYEAKITTENVKRIFTMDKPEKWRIDSETYADENVTGLKP